MRYGQLSEGEVHFRTVSHYCTVGDNFPCQAARRRSYEDRTASSRRLPSRGAGMQTLARDEVLRDTDGALEACDAVFNFTSRAASRGRVDREIVRTLLAAELQKHHARATGRGRHGVDDRKAEEEAGEEEEDGEDKALLCGLARCFEFLSSSSRE